MTAVGGGGVPACPCRESANRGDRTSSDDEMERGVDDATTADPGAARAGGLGAGAGSVLRVRAPGSHGAAALAVVAVVVIAALAFVVWRSRARHKRRTVRSNGNGGDGDSDSCAAGYRDTVDPRADGKHCERGGRGVEQECAAAREDRQESVASAEAAAAAVGLSTRTGTDGVAGAVSEHASPNPDAADTPASNDEPVTFVHSEYACRRCGQFDAKQSCAYTMCRPCCEKDPTRLCEGHKVSRCVARWLRGSCVSLVLLWVRGAQRP